MMVTAKAAGRWPLVYELSERLAVMPADAVETSKHNTQELLSIEAVWSMRLEAQGFHKLLRCVVADDASSRHRVDAALLVIRISHELCEVTSAERAFAAVAPLLDSESTVYSNRVLPILYHTLFGNRDRGLSLARKLMSDLDSLESLCDQLRAANNLSISLLLLGAVEESVAVSSKYLAMTERLGMQDWHLTFCCAAATVHAVLEQFDKLEPWLDRLRVDIAQPVHAFLGRTYFSHSIELAIFKRDEVLASEMVLELAKTGVGESLRGKVYLQSAQIRIRQLDPKFDCDDQTIAELYRLHNLTKAMLTADSETLALGEALKRRGRIEELQTLLDRYFGVRRERTPVPPSFANLLAVCSST
jgi:hypothetical protein